jgi:hypothetical protein
MALDNALEEVSYGFRVTGLVVGIAQDGSPI